MLIAVECCAMVACWIEKICGLRVVLVWAHAPAALLAAETVVVGDGGGEGG